MEWAVNAADNLCSIFFLFGLGGKRKQQFARWSEWDTTELGDMPQALRVGTLTQAQSQHLSQFEVRRIFSHVDCSGEHPISLAVARFKPNEVRDNMGRIEAKYSVALDEFDALCFIDSPSGGRVFYPFWHQ